MKILFDVISTQGSRNGGAEYVLKVFSELLTNASDNIEIICLYDSQKSFPYCETSPQTLSERKLKSIDIKNQQLYQLISDLEIDLLFIGIAQRFIGYNLSQITCRCICVIHDFYDYELDGILDYVYRKNFVMSLRMKFRRHKDCLLKRKSKNDFYSFLNKNQKLSIVTVSEFTRASLLNKVVDNNREIEVLYSPEKISVRDESIENKELDFIVHSNQKYFLIVSAGRVLKNAKTAINAFKRYVELYMTNDMLVTIGYGRSEFANHIDLPFLSTPDLEHAYQNCYALIYPSLWEGFGYPPLEAMKYGKPVLCSNVCSMKEILGDVPIYFSPFYESDIFAALMKFSNCNYQTLCDLSLSCYKNVSKRQKEDLAHLIKMITHIYE